MKSTTYVQEVSNLRSLIPGRPGRIKIKQKIEIGIAAIACIGLEPVNDSSSSFSEEQENLTAKVIPMLNRTFASFQGLLIGENEVVYCKKNSQESIT
jgi:hypothetical protein